MLPEPENRPARVPILTSDPGITSHGPGNLALPVLGIGLGHGPVLGTPMPKTGVEEDDYPSLADGYIWPARQTPNILPKTKTAMP